MKLAHSIKPHHHIAIWFVAFLLVISSAVVRDSMAVSRILAKEPADNSKQLFGANGPNSQEHDFVVPDECKHSKPQDLLRQLEAQKQSLVVQINNLGKQQQNKSGDKTEKSQPRRQGPEQQLQILQKKLSDLQAQIADLQKRIKAGPEDECKLASVHAAISHIQNALDKLDNHLLATVNRIDTLTVKIEAITPRLQAAGVDPAVISHIKDDIATIKTQSIILRTFFANLRSTAQEFFALSKTDPLKAFDTIKSRANFDTTSAAKAADTLRDAFSDLTSTLDKLSR